jgi:hypothetical protein
MLMVLDDRELVTIGVEEDRHEAAPTLPLRLLLETEAVEGPPYCGKIMYLAIHVILRNEIREWPSIDIDDASMCS